MTPTSAMTNTSVQRRGPVQAAGLALLVYLAFNLLLPLVPPLPFPLLAVLGVLSTAVFMLLQLWLTQSLVNLHVRPLVCVLLMLVFAALFLVSLFFVYPHKSWSAAVNAPLFIVTPLLRGLTITLSCAFFGILLSRIIREPNVLLPVALVAMPIDYLGAMTSIGFTQNVVTQNPHLVQALSVPVPAVGSSSQHHGALHAIGFIGPGDALFMAFFFAVVLRLNMNIRGTFWWMYGLLTLTMFVVLSPLGFNIAALVPMGIAVLIANFRYFKLKREEVFATLYAASLILVLVTGFYFYSHSRFSRAASQGDTDVQPNAAHRSHTPRSPAGN
jgi:hypothetical protein